VHQLRAARVSSRPRALRLRATKQHCALYLFSNVTVDRFAEALAGFDLSKGTVRFQPERPIPADLVKALVEARLAECAALDGVKRG
jgi:uncharacterized protein YdhG (YjbR/CyaY superfamily)